MWSFNIKFTIVSLSQFHSWARSQVQSKVHVTQRNAIFMRTILISFQLVQCVCVLYPNKEYKTQLPQLPLITNLSVALVLLIIPNILLLQFSFLSFYCCMWLFKTNFTTEDGQIHWIPKCTEFFPKKQVSTIRIRLYRDDG